MGSISNLSFPFLVVLTNTACLYIWVCHKRLFAPPFPCSSQSAIQHPPDRFRNEFFIMVHAAILAPLLAGVGIGTIVKGIWGHDTQQQQQEQDYSREAFTSSFFEGVPWSFVDGNFGLAAWLIVSQICGLRVLIMDLPKDAAT